MSTPSHTPEPFIITDCDCRLPGEGDDPKVFVRTAAHGYVARAEDAKTAARIQNCLNKLAGHADLDRVAIITKATLAEIRTALLGVAEDDYDCGRTAPVLRALLAKLPA